MANTIVKIFEKNNQKYRLLDYIQATGTQYINLGSFSWNADTDVLETKFKFDTISTTSNALWLYSLQGTSMNFDFYSQNSVFNLRPHQSQQQVYQMEQDTNVHTLKLDCVNSKIYFDNVEKFSDIQKTSISNVQFNLFRRNTGTGYASARIYTFTIKRNGAKILDLIPVERISDNAIGLLDLISGTLYTNAGSGTFGKSYKLVEHIYNSKHKHKTKVYELLEYIESNGTQYIDTGIKDYNNIRLSMELAITNTAVALNIGALEGSGEPYKRFHISKQTASQYFQAGLRNYIDTNQQVVVGTSWHTLSINSTTNNFLVDTKFITLTNTGELPTSNFYLFARKFNETINYSHCRIKNFNVMYGDKTALNLLPVRRLVDNAIGMVDILTNKFYENKGTGTFLYQAKATPTYIEDYVEQVDYIESSGTQLIDTGVKVVNPLVDLDFALTNNTSYANTSFLFAKDYYGDANFSVALPNNTTMRIPAGAGGSFINISIGTLGTTKHNVVYRNGLLEVDGASKSTQALTGQTQRELRLFGRWQTSSEAIEGTAYKMYGCKIYDYNDNDPILLKDFVPVKYGTDYCLLDLVENKLYYNTGTGSFTGGNKVEVQKITQCLISNNVKYYPLDYIESSGTQCIDTLYLMKNNSRVELDAILDKNTTNHQVGLTDVKGAILLLPNQKKIQYGATETYTYDTNRHTYFFDCVAKKMGIVNGTTFDYRVETFEPSMTFGLFARNDGGAMQFQLFGSDRVYSFKAFENNVLVKHLIPVERASDGVKGMLDKVSGTFYANAGSGNFVAGSKKEITLVS